jgi:uncharacterized spore protein YtfJ
MNVQQLLETARDGLTVTRVFAEPYERDGVTVIPAAALRGGVGGGSDGTSAVNRVRAGASVSPPGPWARTSSRRGRSGGGRPWI